VRRSRGKRIVDRTHDLRCHSRKPCLQRDLCRKLTASRGDIEARELLFLQLKVELMAHAAAEERHLYVPLLMDDGGLDASRHALHEHHEVDELLDKLSVAMRALRRALESDLQHRGAGADRTDSRAPGLA
jgi:hypothetical protein